MVVLGRMPKIGVTGATGFIGGALVPYLAERGYELYLVDDGSGPTEVRYPQWPVDHRKFESPEALAELVRCDVVLHLGAISGVMACANDPEGSARSNVAGTAELARACREHRVPIAFASSFTAVGVPKELPVTETTPAAPTHEYGRQKAAGEGIMKEASRGGAVATAVLRQSNVYGGYRAGARTVTKGNVLQLFAVQALSGRLTVNAPGTQRRDFVHILDVIAHWEAAARYLLAPGTPREARTFNVASGEALNILEIADRVAHGYAALHPTAPPIRVDVVPNPRGGVEVIEPEFAVSRVETERRLGVTCRYRIASVLPEILAAAAQAAPR